MPDRFPSAVRSKIMSSIRSKNTRPEMLVRKALWSSGVRYRIHNKLVYGTPDLSIKNRRVAIFIDGCFWHGCQNCNKEPKSNINFWKEKIMSNKKRRRKVKKMLRNENWNVLEIWEHEIQKNPNKVAKKIEVKLSRLRVY